MQQALLGSLLAAALLALAGLLLRLAR